MTADLHNQPVGAVRDLTQWKRRNEFIQEFRDAGMGTLPYFNAGVLLIDVEEWTSKKVFESCSKNLTTFGKFLYNNDQSLLNLTLVGKWQELSPYWNWQISSHRWLFDPIVSPFITHFVGRTKPWDDNPSIWPRSLRDYGRSIDHKANEKGLIEVEGYDLSMWKFFLLCVRHLTSFHHLRRNVERFQTPFHTINPHSK